MNAKIITYVNKETSVITTASVVCIAEQTGIHRNTIANRLSKTGKYEDDKCIMEFSNAQGGDPNAQSNAQPPEPINLNAQVIIDTSPKSEPESPGANPDIEPDITNAEDQGEHQEEYKPEILPRGNCIKCNQLTFRTEIINGKSQFKCHQPCTKTKKIKLVPYVPKVCAEGTSPYIVAAIDRVNQSLKNRMFLPPKRFVPR